MKKYLTKRNILLALLLAFIVMQFFPIDKTNPPVELENDFIKLTEPPTEIAANMKTMCYDCHSHESRYPWYTNIAPFSWRIKSHIDNGRKHLNFSLWGNYSDKKRAHKLEECIDMTIKHWMPTLDYKLMHGRLSDEKYSEMATFFKQAKIQKPITQNFDYLLGSWKRTDEEEGNQTFESWKKMVLPSILVEATP
ncbi:MAG: heme-binding domain-containing protein [Saprospiraceae bacterium]